MSPGRFSLQPFPAAGSPLEITITGEISRRAGTLALRYDLRGRLAEVAIPPVAQQPARRHGLWQETCFELFLGLRKAPPYWEFNLSPAGHWNVYRFSAYRQGMAEETAFTSMRFGVLRRPDSLELALEIDLDRLVPQAAPLEAAVAAVLKLRDGRLSYWALSHPGPRPDFHRRDSFRVDL